MLLRSKNADVKLTRTGSGLVISTKMTSNRRRDSKLKRNITAFRKAPKKIINSGRYKLRYMPDPIPYAGPQFIIHRKSGTVPVMAGCTKCGEKFFTPSTLLKDALGAGEYLRRKFDSHECYLENKKRRWLP